MSAIFMRFANDGMKVHGANWIRQKPSNRLVDRLKIMHRNLRQSSATITCKLLPVTARLNKNIFGINS